MNKATRTIVCVTGTRADYPRIKAVLREITKRPNLQLKLIVTGMHLLKAFGDTVGAIEQDGFDIAARVKMYSEDDSPYGMAKSAIHCADGIADALRQIQPDLVLLSVDRVETLAAAAAAALMNLPIAHVQGGEVTGTIDESIRHAVTKLAHIHFPSTQDAADRIIRMGEDPRHVHLVGCPYLDIIRTVDYVGKEQLARTYGFDPTKPLVIFVQHPVTTEYGQGMEQVKKCIWALQCFPDVEIVGVYSNADAGGREIIATMEGSANFHIFPNIPDKDFLSLMKYAAVMVGNSSAGIREAPSFQLPAVNVGTRQNGRLRAGNVIDVPHDVDTIVKAIETALHDGDFRENLKKVTNPYGDGNSAKRIVDVLEHVELSGQLIQKRITY